MIDYNEIERTLSSRGVYYDAKEYYFVLSIVLGCQQEYAYATTIALDEYKKVKGTEEEKDFFPRIKRESDALLQKQHIIKLKEEVEYQHTKMVQDFALHLEDVELTSSDVKKILASFLRDRIDDPSSASVKELVDLLRMYQPYLPDDASATDFQRHFIQVYPHFNALCVNCNKEFDAVMGISCICPHCGARYNWVQDENRFYPEPAKL